MWSVTTEQTARPGTQGREEWLEIMSSDLYTGESYWIALDESECENGWPLRTPTQAQDPYDRHRRIQGSLVWFLQDSIVLHPRICGNGLGNFAFEKCLLQKRRGPPIMISLKHWPLNLWIPENGRHQSLEGYINILSIWQHQINRCIYLFVYIHIYIKIIFIEQYVDSVESQSKF